MRDFINKVLVGYSTCYNLNDCYSLSLLSTPHTPPQLHLPSLLHIDLLRPRDFTNHLASLVERSMLPLLAVSAYAFQKHTSRLIIRVLWDEAASKCFFQDALAQAFSTIEVCFDCCFKLADD